MRCLQTPASNRHARQQSSVVYADEATGFGCEDIIFASALRHGPKRDVANEVWRRLLFSGLCGMWNWGRIELVSVAAAGQFPKHVETLAKSPLAGARGPKHQRGRLGKGTYAGLLAPCHGRIDTNRHFARVDR
jgi:hypothetical protein